MGQKGGSEDRPKMTAWTAQGSPLAPTRRNPGSRHFSVSAQTRLRCGFGRCSCAAEEPLSLRRQFYDSPSLGATFEIEFLTSPFASVGQILVLCPVSLQFCRVKS